MRWSGWDKTGMTKPGYTVLIRTFNSQQTLPLTLECLANQTLPPVRYVIVDSGSKDKTLDILPAGAVVHRYVGREFNYSEAINQGLEYVETDYVFIISSHAFIIKRNAIEYALGLLEGNSNLGAAYFNLEVDGGPLTSGLIDKSNFDGQNGLWNWCSLIRMDLLKRRKFRPEVFSAEDQEWAGWLFNEEGKAIARIANAGAINYNAKSHSFKKQRNEYVAIAYYTKRERLRWSNILGVLTSVVSPRGGLRPRQRGSQLILAARLIGCRYSEPKAKSRYF